MGRVPGNGGGGGAPGESVKQTLQDSYDGSEDGRIVTDATRKALKVRSGTGVPGDDLLVVEDGVGALLFGVNGLGNMLLPSGQLDIPTGAINGRNYRASSGTLADPHFAIPAIVGGGGLLRGVGNSVAISVSGTQPIRWLPTQTQISPQPGGVGALHIVSQSDLNTGVAWGNSASPDRLELITGNVVAIECTSGQQCLGQDGTFSLPTWGFIGTPDRGITNHVLQDRLALVSGGEEGAAVDASGVVGGTRFHLYDNDNATMTRVRVGAPDSGGIGFKILRINN